MKSHFRHPHLIQRKFQNAPSESVIGMLRQGIQCSTNVNRPSQILRALFPTSVLLCLAVGCASTGQMNVKTPLTRNLSTYKTLQVQLSPAPRGWHDLAEQLRRDVVDGLRAETRFNVISFSAEPSAVEADMLVKISLQEVREVTSQDRMMTGAFAGRGAVVADVDVVERQSGQILGSATMEGKTSGGSIFAGTTPEAIKRVSEKIVDFISQSAK